ncbi:MAG: DinB family protein [Trueperaceae bacterium]
MNDCTGEGRSFVGYYESHPAQLLQHCIVHDSHHRGHILALLRQAGRRADVREGLEGSTWSVWRE